VIARFVYGVRLGELDKYVGVWKGCIFQVQETCILLWACVVANLIKRQQARNSLGNRADHLLSIETSRIAANHYSSTVAASKQDARRIYRDDWSRSMMSTAVGMVKQWS
jgi:hypothetical protein